MYHYKQHKEWVAFCLVDEQEKEKEYIKLTLLAIGKCECRETSI